MMWKQQWNHDWKNMIIIYTNRQLEKVILWWKFLSFHVNKCLVSQIYCTCRGFSKSPHLIWFKGNKVLNHTLFITYTDREAHDSIVGWGAVLQTGRLWVPFSMRSLDFSIELTPPAVLCSWSNLSHSQKWVPGIFLGVNGGQHIRPMTSSHSMSWLSRKCWSFHDLL
jgi:hypothetical protein